MTYEIYLNANNGAYSDRIGNFDSREKAEAFAKEVVEFGKFNYNSDYDNITMMCEEDEEEMTLMYVEGAFIEA